MNASPKNPDPMVERGIGGASAGEVAGLTGDAAPQGDSLALPIGTRLGEFEIVERVGDGGFSIVYLAWDLSLDRRVAIKEFMPSSIAVRADATQVRPRSERHRRTFDAALRSFVGEAKLLAHFDHPSLVKVYRFWEANGTAYMVMPHYKGRTVREAVLAMPSPPDQAWLMSLLDPLSAALSVIHAEHCYHRDIAPDNVILLVKSGRPVLLDFGAARRLIAGMTQSLTVILKPGFAPVEQYGESPGAKQGPWTDVYALGAMAHWAITGKAPPASIGRVLEDSYVPLSRSVAGRYSDAFLQAIDRALEVRPERRTSSVARFRKELGLDGSGAPGASTPGALPRGLSLARRLGAAVVLVATAAGAGYGLMAWTAAGGGSEDTRLQAEEALVKSLAEARARLERLEQVETAQAARVADARGVVERLDTAVRAARSGVERETLIRQLGAAQAQLALESDVQSALAQQLFRSDSMAQARAKLAAGSQALDDGEPQTAANALAAVHGDLAALARRAASVRSLRVAHAGLGQVVADLERLGRDERLDVASTVGEARKAITLAEAAAAAGQDGQAGELVQAASVRAVDALNALVNTLLQGYTKVIEQAHETGRPDIAQQAQDRVKVVRMLRREPNRAPDPAPRSASATRVGG